MKKYRTLRITGKGYTVYGLTPLTVKRIVTTLRGLQVNELGDIPEGAEIMVKAVSYAVTGSGLFSRFRASLLSRRLLRRASQEECISALQVIVGMIPANEFYMISSITNQFNQFVSR